MRSIKTLTVLCGFFLGIAVQGVQAGKAGTVAGQTLLKPSGARPAALGEAFTSVTGDVAAFPYNPASLESLKNGQASFLYEKGFEESTFGQILFGRPLAKGGLGLSIGYFSAGDVKLIDENLQAQDLNAQNDLTLAGGYAQTFKSVRWGVSGKFISSELMERYTARAVALDLGLQADFGLRTKAGLALQNIGTKMKYDETGFSLPRIYRAGINYQLIQGPYATHLLLDLPFYAAESKIRPAAGVESGIGPMRFRLGFRNTDGLENVVAMGAGFHTASGTLDYSFGMVDDVSDTHLISFTLNFGAGLSDFPPAGTRESPSRPDRKQIPIQKLPVTPQTHTAPSQPAPKGDTEKPTYHRVQQVYTVKPGDTLSKIAQRYYGDHREWRKVFNANRHLLKDGQSLEIGQKLILP